MSHRAIFGWLGDRRRSERVFLILFPIMTALFVYVQVHRERVHSDHTISSAQVIANDKLLATQYEACLRGVNLRTAVNDAHRAIKDFMTAAIHSAERRAKLETGAKRASDLKAESDYRKFRARFELVPQVNCVRVIYGSETPPATVRHT